MEKATLQLRNAIENILGNLMSQKIVWKQFFEEKKTMIEKEINKNYLALFRKVQYQEEFNQLIKTNTQLSNELFEKYNEKYFKNLPTEKKNEIISWIEKACEKEYNILKEDNKRKPKWESINKNMKIIIQEIINHYIENIFNGKNFRNEINPSLGRTDIILSKIPNEIIQNPEIPQTKLKEINDMVSDEIKKAVDLFNKKRDELPLFEEILSIKEKICNQISDEKTKELMSKFYYAEDKIPFYKDNFYSLLKNNEKISFKIPQNNREFNNMINRVSEKKAYEYNEILVPKRPKWNKIKKELKLKIQSECDEFYKKVMTNKFYKEDVKFDINKLEH